MGSLRHGGAGAGRAALLLAVLSISWGSILVRLCDSPSWTIAFWRVALASCLMAPWGLSAAAGRRIHDDKAECEQALQIARERRLLDIEGEADFDRGDTVLLSELGQQRELAAGNAERAHRIVVDACDDAGELAHASRNAQA